MTLHIKNIWLAINKVLTIINAVLIGLVTGNIGLLYNTQKEKFVKVPVAANILLLLVLSFVLLVFVFKYS